MITIIKKANKLALDIKVLKSHLRIEHEHEDEYLKILIEAATDVLEKAIGISLIKKKYKYKGPEVETLPIQPVIRICTNKNGETTFDAGITDNEEEIPVDLKYAVLQIARNMYECNDEDILKSHYIKHVINNYKQISII
jgi:hypothetical protein